MREAFRNLAVLAGGLWLAGCATAQQPYNTNQDALSPDERKLQAVENQLVVVNRRLDAIAAAQQDGQLSDEVRTLRGQVEVLRHEVQQNQKQLKTTLQQFNQRLQRLELGGGTVPVPPPAHGQSSGAAQSSVSGNGGNPAQASSTIGRSATVPSEPSSTTATTDQSASGSQKGVQPAKAVETAYIHSLNQLQSGNLEKAISSFKAFLKQYPDGDYADNAWYWLGSAYYVKGNTNDALASFHTLLTKFPNSPKVADTLVKIGIINQDAHKIGPARSAFQRVINNYPDSNAASIAKQRLAKISG